MRFKLEANLGDGWKVVDECLVCEMEKSKCICEKKDPINKKNHKLWCRKEKRNGKIVTVIGDFSQEKDKIKDKLTLLKKRLATGGSIKDSHIELQGDFCEEAKKILEEKM